MKPLAWSHSSLSDFVSCPHAYYEKRIAKSVVEQRTQPMIWGEYVHKQFELRQKEGRPLPDDLEEHEEYMLKLATMPGQGAYEQKIGLNLRMEPCGFFDKTVWHRGIIDYRKVQDNKAHIVDYKTGKPHAKFEQLMLNALHTFALLPAVDEVRVDYYWTTTRTTTGEAYSRREIPLLWKKFLPDLKQYAEAFRTDTWQKRQSGLCNGWCPVTSCEFWKPKRDKR